MSEEPIIISNLNDFIFCPVSIYFHSLDEEENILSQDSYQLNGTNAHKSSDSATYSTKKSMLQGMSVFCEKYNIIGKIDTFDSEKGILTERKKKIKTIYDGYIFQIYAQYFALIEMGYIVNELRLYSMDDNRMYKIAKPENDRDKLYKFEKVISDMNSMGFDSFRQSNKEKCRKCIYEPLCGYSDLKEDE